MTDRPLTDFSEALNGCLTALWTDLRRPLEWLLNRPTRKRRR